MQRRLCRMNHFLHPKPVRQPWLVLQTLLWATLWHKPLEALARLQNIARLCQNIFKIKEPHTDCTGILRPTTWTPSTPSGTSIWEHSILSFKAEWIGIIYAKKPKQISKPPLGLQGASLGVLLFSEPMSNLRFHHEEKVMMRDCRAKKDIAISDMECNLKR